MKTFKHTCLMCGKEFESRSKQSRFCYEQHYVKCCICGAEIEVPKNNVDYYFKRLGETVCNSGKCKRALSAKKKGMSLEEYNKSSGEQIRQAMQEKYGVDNPGQLSEAIAKREQTCLEKYGVKNVNQTDEVKEKKKQTCLEKYGKEYVTQTEEFKNKSKQTCIEKYGVEYSTQTDIMKEHSKQTMMEKYGVEYALQSDEILNKRKQTNLERYGVEEVFQNSEVRDRYKQNLEEKYGVDNPAKLSEVKDKIKETNLERYGKEYYTQTEEYKIQSKETCLEKYGVDHHLKAEEVKAKRYETNQQKYGSPNLFSSEYGKRKVKQSLKEKFGVTNPSQSPELRAKAIRTARGSNLETKISKLFDNYHIEYVRHYHLHDESTECYHEFDFYLPKYKLLIDADGVYFHSYLSDPDGKHVNDYYDDIRISLVPPDHIFHVIVEGTEESQVSQIVKLLEQTDEGIFDYDSEIFKWCRSIDFPYPTYSHSRLQSDWKNLCNRPTDTTYVRQCRVGESIIKDFHTSIYDCRRKGSCSPIQAWYDDNKLKRVIKNRLIYKNDVDPSKILSGFNISKICPVVSIFNPILARYIVNKYLSEYSQVFDPFSGFSGRLLGVASTNKEYIGQDLNENVVEESNEIIEYLNLSPNCSVIHKDILESSGEYECLLTCPPYNDKEIYNHETIFKTCDEWIEECLTRFKCKRYVFVVDETTKYSDYVVEHIKSTSHFANVDEKIIVITP